VSQSFACLVKTAFQSFDNLKTVLRRARRDKSIDTTLTFSNTVLYFAGTGIYGNYGKSRVHVRVTAKELRGTTLQMPNVRNLRRASETNISHGILAGEQDGIDASLVTRALFVSSRLTTQTSQQKGYESGAGPLQLCFANFNVSPTSLARACDLSEAKPSLLLLHSMSLS